MGWEGEVCGFEQSAEVAGGGGAGEGDGVGVVIGYGKESLQGGDGVGRKLVAVGFGDGDGGTCGGEGFGDVVAGLCGADEEKGSAGSLWEKSLGEGFADVARGDEVDGEADGIGCGESGGADDGDVFWELGEVEELGSAMKGFDGVGAGEEEPVVGAEAGESCVERGERDWGDDFDGWDEDRRCA